MKKTYMRFTAGAPGANGGAAPTVEKKKDGEGTEKSEGDDDEDSELKHIEKIANGVESLKALLGDKADTTKMAALESDITALKAGLEEMNSKEISRLVKSINTKNAELYNDMIKAVQELADINKENGGASMVSAAPIVSEAEIKAFALDTFKGNLLGKSKQHTTKTITIKAPETFGQAVTFVSGTDISAFTGRYVDPKLNVRKRKKNFILDNIQIQTITVPTLVYLEKVEIGDANTTSGDPGAANWILSGAAKPQRSFRVKSAQVEAKKVAIYGRIEDKLLRDVPSFQNWIREDFIDEMREKINDGLLNNNPGVNALAPLGLKINAVQYAVTPAFDENVLDPNYIDAIIAAIAFMADKKEDPGMAVVSSDVFYAIQNLKDNTGKYQNSNLVYTNTLGQLYIAGVHVIWADREDVPSTHLLLIANDLGFKVFAYGPMVIESGLNGEDFRQDKTSFRGYQEFLSYIASNRVNSVMYDTFANVFAAIVAPDAGS